MLKYEAKRVHLDNKILSIIGFLFLTKDNFLKLSSVAFWRRNETDMCAAVLSTEQSFLKLSELKRDE